MSALKKSDTRRCKHVGNRGKRQLYDALQFFFLLHAKSYRKTHPEFLTPSVDEFLDFSRSVGIVLEKGHITPKRKHRRAVPMKSTSDYLELRNFLQFIIGPGLVGHSSCKTILKLNAVVLMALLVWMVVEEYLAIVAESTGEVSVVVAGIARAGSPSLKESLLKICDSTYIRNELRDPLRFYLDRTATILNNARDALLVHYVNYTRSVVLPRLLDLPKDLPVLGHDMSITVGESVISVFASDLLVPTVADLTMFIPMSFIFGTVGIQSCKEICQEKVEYYKDLGYTVGKL